MGLLRAVGLRPEQNPSQSSPNHKSDSWGIYPLTPTHHQLRATPRAVHSQPLPRFWPSPRGPACFHSRAGLRWEVAGVWGKERPVWKGRSMRAEWMCRGYRRSADALCLRTKRSGTCFSFVQDWSFSKGGLDALYCVSSKREKGRDLRGQRKLSERDHPH